MTSGVVIQEATGTGLAGWDDLVMGFENYRLFQKAGWLRSIATFTGARPLGLIFEKDGERVGCLPGLLQRVGFVRVFGSPLIGWQTMTMGPAFDPRRISTNEMFTALVPFLEDRYNVQHIELASQHLDHGEMMALGFRPTRLFSYRVRLFPGDEERVFKGIDPKTRNQIRKAIKLGLRVTVESEESFIDEFYDQTREVFARHGKAVPFSRNRVLQGFRYMKAAGNLLAIAVRMPDSDVCLATGMFMIEGRELHFWGWTHRSRYRWYCPSEILIWTAMQKAMEAGCVTFDMAGGGDAKVKFGATPDESAYRWMRSRYRWIDWLRVGAERGYRWQQSVRGHVARLGLAARWRVTGKPVSETRGGTNHSGQVLPRTLFTPVRK